VQGFFREKPVMRALVIHAPRDLRVEPVETPDLGPRDVRVRVEAGGICGSDLHYYLDGGFGRIRLREPMILGHEVAGRVESVGAEVTRVVPGDRVAIDPSRPCGRCRYCLEGRAQHCTDMKFYGSAMRFPHVHGGFRDVLVIEESQAVPVGKDVSAAEAAFAEPLAVCLHAISRAGALFGKRVLITGSGPIGALVALAARRAGAIEIVATEPEALRTYEVEKGYFDVMFEASGAGRALVGALEAIRPGGTIVLVGVGGEVGLPIDRIVAKELEIRGTFRFFTEFALAADFISRRLVDVRPLLTETMPLDRAVEAFELARDRSRAMKVQLSFA
jgi:L-idonate 5-dehydrogenase